MKKERLLPLIGNPGAKLPLVLALAVGVAAWAGSEDAALANSDQRPPEVPTTTDEADRTAAAPRLRGSDAAPGSEEGVKVHGHWTIEVREPDGTLVDHREFENALSSTHELASILARSKTVGSWEIQLVTPSTQEVCEEPSGTPITICIILEPSSTATENNVFKNLTITSGTDLTLAGSVVAARDGTISKVSTWSNRCAGTVAPATCPGSENDYSNFTDTTLSSPVPVLLGQQVQVSVVISFN